MFRYSLEQDKVAELNTATPKKPTEVFNTTIVQPGNGK